MIATFSKAKSGNSWSEVGQNTRVEEDIMELREYAKIICRHLWVVILLPLIALLSGLLVYRPPTPLYQASMRFTIGVQPQYEKEVDPSDALYYSELASEYIADDFSEVVKSEAFAQDVSARLEGITISPGIIAGSTAAAKQHRILTMIITWPNAEELEAIAQAAIAALEQENAKYFAQLGAAGAQVYVIDPPKVISLGVPLKERLDLPIRVLLGLIAGVGLAFLLDYLDTSLRSAEEVRQLGIEVLGEIPGRSVWRRLSSRKS
jgi:capsular polysaccharide biosynthesis protein